MCLLVAVGVFLTLGGAVNAASVQDEARQFFERFVAAQNAHDLATVGSMLWNSEDFLWVTRGVQVRGSETAFNRPGVKSGNMHRSAPLSSLFKPEQSLTGVPRLFVALELCSHAGTK